MPRVSVNICCYNSEKFIKDTIQSVLAQTYTDYEIIVIDDGSKDRTREIIGAFGDSRIKYHYQKNRGLSFSRNQALKHSSGEYIALLDHDDLWDVDKLELQVSILESEPATGVVYSGARIIDGDGRTLCEWPQRRYRSGRVTKDLVMVDFVPCPTIIFRRALLDTTGFFKEYFVHVEEYELLLRLSLVSDFSYVQKTVVSYRKHSANASRDLVSAYTERIQCLLGFMGEVVDEEVKNQIRNSLFFQQALFVLLYLYNSMYQEADVIIKTMRSIEKLQKFIYIPTLRFLSLLPAGVCRLLLCPVKMKGLVNEVSRSL